MLLLGGALLSAQSPLEDTLTSARIAVRGGAIDTALASFKTAFELARSTNPQRIPGIGVAWADLLQNTGRPVDAQAVLLNAADVSAGIGVTPANQVPIASRLYRLAPTLNSAGETTEARQALDRSRTILTNAYGPDAPCVATVLRQLANLDLKLGNNTAATQDQTEFTRITLKQAQLDTAAGVARIGGGIGPPKVIQKVDPPYTDQARAAHYSGTALLSLVVGTDGLANDIQVMMPLGEGLDENAIDTVRQWRFQPATKQTDGQPVPVRATIEINFRLL